MCQVNVKCPECGTINRNLYLNETEGRYVCEHCGYEGLVEAFFGIWDPKVQYLDSSETGMLSLLNNRTVKRMVECRKEERA